MDSSPASGPSGNQDLGLESSIRSCKTTVTVSSASLPIALRTSALTGSLWVPSPMAMNELRKGWPSIVPRTFTSPRVPKNSTDSGQTTYVQPPFDGLLLSLALNCLFNMPPPYPRRDRAVRAEKGPSARACVAFDENVQNVLNIQVRWISD